MSDPLTALLHAVNEGRPEALGLLADWCDEQGEAGKARRLRKYQLKLATRVAQLAGDKTLRPAVARYCAARKIGLMRDYVRRMFPAEWPGGRQTWRAIVKAARAAKAITDLEMNLRRIYGSTQPPREGPA